MKVTLQNFKKITIWLKNGETVVVSKSERLRGKYVSPSNIPEIEYYIVYDMDITNEGDDIIVTLEMVGVPKKFINATHFTIKKRWKVESLTLE